MQAEKSFLVAKLMRTFLNLALHTKAAVFMKEKVKGFFRTRVCCMQIPFKAMYVFASPE